MGLDNYFVKMIRATPELDWPEVHLVGGMFSGNGSNGSFRGKVYDTLVQRETGYSLYDESDADDVKEIAEKLSTYAEEIKDLPDEEIVETEWEVTAREARDLATLFAFAAKNDCELDSWY